MPSRSRQLTAILAIQEPQLATQLLVHAKRLNGNPDATLQLFDLFKPPTHQRPPPSGENAAGLSLLDGQLGGGQYLLGAGQLLGLTRQLRARIFTLWKVPLALALALALTLTLWKALLFRPKSHPDPHPHPNPNPDPNAPP